MGIVLNDQNNRTELQERIKSELREKIAKGQGAGPDPDTDEKLRKTPDFVKDSEYVKNYKKKPTKNSRVVGIVVVCIVVFVLIGILVAIS